MDEAVNRTYRSVITDVVEAIKPDFVADGVDEAVLDELRVLWEAKLRASGALKQEAPRPQLPPGLVGNLAAYGQLGRAPQQLHQGALPYNAAAHFAASLPAHQGAEHRQLLAAQLGHQPARLSQQALLPGAEASSSGLPAPQAQASSAPGGGAGTAERKRPAEGLPGPAGPSKQQKLAAGSEKGLVKGKAAAEGTADGKDAEETFSDVDDSEDEAAGAEVKDIVLTQYEKVVRTKNRWKMTLKHGVIRSGGRDYLFHEAVGDMQF